MAVLDKEGAVVRTKRLSLFLAVVAFVSIGMPLALSAFHRAVHGHPVWWLAFLVYFAGVVAVFKAWTEWWNEQRGRLRADETGLWLGERCVIRREAVRHGYVFRRGERTYVRLGRALRHVEVEVADEAEGEALLVAMRLDSGRSVAQYAMTNGTWRASFLRASASTLPVVLAPVVAFLLGGALPTLLGSLVVGSVFTLLYALDQLLRVSVGADGIRVKSLVQHARFVPFSAIESARTDGTNITIRLHDGESIRIHSPAGANAKKHGLLARPIALSDRVHEARKLVDRIEEQLAARRARGNVDAPAFARAGRKTGEWLREVAGATDATATYRTPAVPPEELWRIVEDTAASPTARAGAAAALRKDLDGDGRLRLRAAADACAAPRLRIALETVASDDDLHPAFDPLEDHDIPQRKAMPLPPR